MFQFELDFTFADYATKTRKFKAVTIRKRFKINAENAILAERILQDEIINDAPRRHKREFVLSGICKDISNDGRIIGQYNLDLAFIADKTENK